jgi:hypothetical protein
MQQAGTAFQWNGDIKLCRVGTCPTRYSRFIALRSTAKQRRPARDVSHASNSLTKISCISRTMTTRAAPYCLHEDRSDTSRIISKMSGVRHARATEELKGPGLPACFTRIRVRNRVPYALLPFMPCHVMGMKMGIGICRSASVASLTCRTKSSRPTIFSRLVSKGISSDQIWTISMLLLQ